jgi:DNA-binding MarR family transcriptional regulator
MNPAGAVLELAPPQLGGALEFMQLVWALDHALQARSKGMKATIGVTGPQCLAIRLIARFPGIPAGRIAELMRVDPSTLSGILKRLERQGLVKRRPDPRDGRRALFGITEKGLRIDAARAGTVEAAVESVIAAMPPSKLEHAREVLKELSRSLVDRGPGPGPAPPAPRKARARVEQ